MPAATTWNALAANWSTLVVAVVWQSTLLAALVACVAWLLRRSSPAIRYWLWQIVAIKILLAPLWTLAVPLAWLPAQSAELPLVPVPHISLPEADETLPMTRRADALPHPAPAARSSTNAAPPTGTSASPWQALSWQAWVLCVWAAVVTAQVARLIAQRVSLGRLLRRADAAEPALCALVADCAARLHLARVPRVLVTSEECSPFVCGIWRPTIVLTRSLETLLPADQLAPVLVHELAHVKRLDLLWGWIPQIAKILYFFHPVAHWVAFRVRLEGELACDGWAMNASATGARDYAELLVRVVSRLSEPAMLRSGSVASASLAGQLPRSRPHKEGEI